jgi:hypothetical protein
MRSKMGKPRKLILGYVLALQRIAELGVVCADSAGVTEPLF